uniref:Aa_trans domain-containing protein n=1 Tax=Angiostrongylus cantonensis TaxID=6313 RepID=A0A0K0D4Y6_ANGCA
MVRIAKFKGTVPIYLALLTFPLMNFKSPTFFTKFNVLGTFSVFYLLVFTAAKLFECGFNMDFTDRESIHYAKPFSWKFPALTGTMTLSYFIHNAVVTILRNQNHPEHNTRDLAIGYLLAAVCYIFIGFTFYAGFPVFRSCISDNFLNNFGPGDILSSTARLFLLFQMITVLPLLMFLIRSQLCYAFLGKTWPGVGLVMLMNCGIICIAVAVAIFYPNVGSILR